MQHKIKKDTINKSKNSIKFKTFKSKIKLLIPYCLIFKNFHKIKLYKEFKEINN